MHRVVSSVMVVSLCFAACTAATKDLESSKTTSGPAAKDPSSGSAPGTGHSTLGGAVDTADERSLNRQYETCLLDAGFDPKGVQVLLDDMGAPWWVKTGHNVPADLHGPCYRQIGGEPNGLPSWG